VKEVKFLKVVIGPRGVKIQKEKMQGVLNWSAPRNVKEIQKFLGLANYYRRFKSRRKCSKGLRQCSPQN